MSVVGDTGEMPAQLNRSGKLTALVEGGTDRRGLLLGDDEHCLSMGALAAPDKPQLAFRNSRSTPNVVRSGLVCTPAEPLSK